MGSVDVAGTAEKNDGFMVAGRLFPRNILWPGFAINTIFYAAILWLLFFAPFKLRAWRRGKRNLCRACNYDLRGNPTPGSGVCPECGQAVNG